MENYKGIYYKETKEQKYYEGGAHFSYKVLFNILLDLGGTFPQKDYNDNYSINNIPFKKQEDKIKVKYKTRNLEQNEYKFKNNPNTLIKYPSQNMINNKENNNKNCISRNYRNSLYNAYSYLKNKNFGTCINSHQPKKNLDNHLLHVLLNKKEKVKYNEEKNNEESSNDNRYSILKFYKNTHYRNRSEYYSNIEKNKKNKINKVENINDDSKNNFATFIRNKINLIKSYKNDKNSSEINEKNQESKEINEMINNNEEIINRSKNKPYLNYLDNNSKNSRNIVNNNLLEYNNTYESNKKNVNVKYDKNSGNDYLFKTSEVRKRENNKNDFKVNRNEEQNNFSNYYRNDAFKSKQIVNKEINENRKLINFGIQKYKRKKIGQLCCFNQNNGKSKSGNNIFAKNINKINIISNKLYI